MRKKLFGESSNTRGGGTTVAFSRAKNATDPPIADLSISDPDQAAKDGHAHFGEDGTVEVQGSVPAAVRAKLDEMKKNTPQVSTPSSASKKAGVTFADDGKVQYNGNVPPEMRAMLAEIEVEKQKSARTREIHAGFEKRKLDNKAVAFLEELDYERGTVDDDESTSTSTLDRLGSFGAWLGKSGIFLSGRLFDSSDPDAAPASAPATASAPSRRVTHDDEEEKVEEIGLDPSLSMHGMAVKKKQAAEERERKRVAAAKAKKAAEEKADAERVAAAKAKKAAELEEWKRKAAEAKAKEESDLQEWVQRSKSRKAPVELS